MGTKQKLLVIVGPTASGKSALAVRLARIFNGEIISADSRQVYRGLDIGTGKVTKREMMGVVHHLLDVSSPHRTFTASDFARLARKAHSQILKNSRVPIVVGGTGFYIDALVGRISLPDVRPNPVLRDRMSKRSSAQLYALLQRRDPVRAMALSSPSERNNKVRLIRALEVAAAKAPATRPEKEYDVLWIGISPTLSQIEKNIHVRLLTRFARGMVAEAQRIHRAGLSYRRMEALGLEYRSLARYLQKKITRVEMIAELDRDIRRYAKKQMTYWKRNPDIRWFTTNQQKKIATVVRRWLKE